MPKNIRSLAALILPMAKQAKHLPKICHRLATHSVLLRYGGGSERAGASNPSPSSVKPILDITSGMRRSPPKEAAHTHEFSLVHTDRKTSRNIFIEDRGTPQLPKVRA